MNIATGRVERQYYHDLEGFIWILPWVFLQFEGPRRTNRQLADWETSDFEACRKQKSDLCTSASRYSPTNSWRSEWKGFAVYILTWVGVENAQRFLHQQKGAPIAPAPADVFNAFCKVLHRCSGMYPAIGDILREMSVTLPTSSSSHPPEHSVPPPPATRHAPENTFDTLEKKAKASEPS